MGTGPEGSGLAVWERHEATQHSVSSSDGGLVFSCPPGTHEPLVTSFIFHFKDEKDEARAG